MDQRRWIIGDPDHCIAQIKALQEDSGGFGALLMLTLEWTSTERWYKSLELFARYVMPQFKGSLRGITNSYERMVEDAKQGRDAQLAVGARPGADRPGAGPVARRAAQEGG